jgi:serine/threonine-protein kinase
LGPIGEPCHERVCARFHRHFVPGDFAVAEPGALLDPLIGRRLGDVLVVEAVGAGAFGRVYLALQLPLRMRVAVKIMRVESSASEALAEVAARFEVEAQALARLQHPNLVRLVSYGKLHELPYLVMEYVEGGVSLDAEIEERAKHDGRYSVTELRSLFRQLLAGLAAAHAMGIVHRDIKPANLMIQDVAGNPRLLRILDFGIAKFVDDGPTMAGAIGTPAYMAPEQFASLGVGPPADLFAVSVLAFELLLGRCPFPAATPEEQLARRLDRSYDPLATVADFGLPATVEALFRRALAYEPAARFATTAELGRALEAVLTEIERDPGHPLRAVRLGGLVDDRRSTLLAWRAAPAVQAADSDEAFRRWLGREARRLGIGEPDDAG